MARATSSQPSSVSSDVREGRLEHSDHVALRSGNELSKIGTVGSAYLTRTLSRRIRLYA